MTGVDPQRDLESSLDRSFGPHLQAVCERTAQALESCGYASLLVYAGSPLSVFDYMKRISVGCVTKSGYAAVAEDAHRLAIYEGFDAHARATARTALSSPIACAISL